MTGDREALLRELADVLHRAGCRDDGDGGSCGGTCLDDADALLPVERAVTAARAEARRRALYDAYWTAHVHRLDPVGRGQGIPNSFYAGVIAARTYIGRIAEREGIPVGMGSGYSAPPPSAWEPDLVPVDHPLTCGARHTVGDLTMYCGLPPHGEETQHDNHGVRW